MTDLVSRLEAQLGGPRDGALLRFSLGNALLAAGDPAGAATSFRDALGFDDGYSAAWKMLGRALEASGDRPGAAAAYEAGIEAAAQRGDEQARKEMMVFLKRARRPPAT